MLKIVRSTEAGSVVFALSGRLEVAHARELERSIEAEELPVVIDLDDVRLIDRDTVPSLARWTRQGVTLRSCPGYIRAWIALERNHDRPPGDHEEEE